MKESRRKAEPIISTFDALEIWCILDTLGIKRYTDPKVSSIDSF